MATLIERQQYGLTSQGNHSSNKTIIFVKLTDSALRAIEQYLSTKVYNSCNFKPSIQFNPQTTQGVISLPIRSNEHDEKQRFSFTISNIDNEGPQGSFECVRQTKNKTLESYGSMHYKMHIHASEDSYQKTKVKMAVVEQENKKNCTKVIKASGPNVGRKVKVKNPLTTTHKIMNPGLCRSSSPNIRLNTSISNSIHNSLSNSVNNSKLLNPTTNNSSIATHNSTTNNSSTGNHNSTTNNSSIGNHIKSHSSSSINSSDLSKKLLREKVTQLLSLRPYSKPELLVRLSKLGTIDKNELSTILNDIAVIKDDAYHLANDAVHEIQYDLPRNSSNFSSNNSNSFNNFNNAEEKDYLKINNNNNNNNNSTHSLQNGILHNGISPIADCSSSNAFSPQSMTDFINSPSVSPNCNGSTVTNKRNIENNSSITKKPRVVDSTQLCKSSKFQTNNYNDLLNGWANKPSSPEVNSSNHQNGSNTGISHYNNTDLRNVDYYQNNTNNSPDSNGIVSHQQFSTQQSSTQQSTTQQSSTQQSTTQQFSTQQFSTQQFSTQPENRNSYMSNKEYGRNNNNNNTSCSNSNKGINNHSYNHYNNKNGHLKTTTNGASAGSINSTPNSSPDSGTGSNDGSVKSSYSTCSDGSDYISKYIQITNEEQRAKYKADFYHEYEEYRRLHRYIEDVANKFSELGIRLNTKTEGSEEWSNLMDLIVREYEETKSNAKFQEARRRMLYLHDKLAHIKKLVIDFDRTHPKRINRVGQQKPIVS